MVRRVKSVLVLFIGSALGACVGISLGRGVGSEAGAEEVRATAPPPWAGSSPPLRELWQRAERLERQRAFDASAHVWEQLVALRPGVSHAYWRAARSHYRAGQGIPIAEETRRKDAFGRTLDWAGRGIEVDPGCAECHLYAFIGLSMVSRIDGTLSSAREARRMKALLDRTLELGPSYVDDPWNHELANAYYAAGVFYKVVPDSALARWALGVRRDIRRSREYYRKALEICDRRIDYRLSLGSTLLCLGQREEDARLVAEGEEHLRRIRSLEDYLATDPIDREHAERLMAHPELACQYSRDEWRRAEGR